MKKQLLIITLFVFVLTISCKKEKKDKKTEEPTQVESKPKKLAITLSPRSSSDVSGNVVFKQDNNRVTMTAIISGLAQGEHAIHIHEKADCSAEDGTSSGGHWNPTGQPHGKWNASTGFHKGDIGNFTANENGHGTITFATDLWCIGCGDQTKDILGKSIIVHQGVDDFVSQPSGAAGSRVSCGGIIQ